MCIWKGKMDMKKKKERKREKIFAIHTHSPNLIWSNRLQGTAASKVNIVLFPIRFIVYLLISFCSAKKMEIVQLHTQKRSNRTNESKRKDEEKTLDRHANNGSKDAVDSFFDSYVLLCMFLFSVVCVYFPFRCMDGRRRKTALGLVLILRRKIAFDIWTRKWNVQCACFHDYETSTLARVNRQ